MKPISARNRGVHIRLNQATRYCLCVAVVTSGFSDVNHVSSRLLAATAAIEVTEGRRFDGAGTFIDPSGSYGLRDAFIDPSGKILFLTNTTGNGIDAVQIESGKVVWSSKDAWLPIALAGSRLYALGVTRKDNVSEFRLYVFETSDGKLWLRSNPILPKDVIFDPTAPRDRFEIEDSFFQGQHLFLNWRATHKTASRPGAGIRGVKQSWAGAIDVDLQAGTSVEIVARKSASKPKLSEPMKAVFAALKRSSDTYFEPSTGAYHKIAESNVSPFFRRGKQVAALAIRSKDQTIRSGARYAHDKLVLQTWDPTTGKEADPIELYEAKHGELRVHASCDHVFVIDMRAPQRGTCCMSLRTGKSVGQVRGEPQDFPFQIIDDKVFCRRDFELRVLDLKSGKLIWAYPLCRRPVVPEWVP